MSADKDRVTELNNRITAIQAKTAADNQEALSFAHIVRVAQDEANRLAKGSK